MIRIERTALPEGLSAVAYRDHDGSLVICVSETLDAARQRAAVIEAMRAARRVGWREGLPVAGAALFVAVRALLHRVTRPLTSVPAGGLGNGSSGHGNGRRLLHVLPGHPAAPGQSHGQPPAGPERGRTGLAPGPAARTRWQRHPFCSSGPAHSLRSRLAGIRHPRRAGPGAGVGWPAGTSTRG